MPPDYYTTSRQAYRTTATGDAPPPASFRAGTGTAATAAAGRRTSTPNATTAADNLKPRRAPGPPRRRSSPSRGQPAPPPLSLSKSSLSLASSSFFLSEPTSPGTATSPYQYPSLALPSASAVKAATTTTPPAARAVAAAPTLASTAAGAPTTTAAFTTNNTTSHLSQTLTTAYPATDAPGPGPANRESFISILDDPFFLRYDFDPASDPESPSSLSPRDHQLQLQLPDPPRSAADYQQHHQHHQPWGDENAASPRWPPPRRESLTISNSPFLVCDMHTCPPPPASFSSTGSLFLAARAV